MRASKKDEDQPKRRRPPATTPEARENQLIAQAVDLAEKQILDGTASSQVITHFLKLGSTQHRLEKEKLEEENKLLRAKTKALEREKNIEALYGDALKAMSIYKGRDDSDEN